MEAKDNPLFQRLMKKHQKLSFSSSDESENSSNGDMSDEEKEVNIENVGKEKKEEEMDVLEDNNKENFNTNNLDGKHEEEQDGEGKITIADLLEDVQSYQPKDNKMDEVFNFEPENKSDTHNQPSEDEKSNSKSEDHTSHHDSDNVSSTTSENDEIEHKFQEDLKKSQNINNSCNNSNDEEEKESPQKKNADNFQKDDLDSEMTSIIPEDTPSKMSDMNTEEPKIAGIETLNSLFQKHDEGLEALFQAKSDKEESDKDQSDSEESSSSSYDDTERVEEKIKEKQAKQNLPASIGNPQVNPKFDKSIPVHDKMMQLYFKADEYIEEASCEQSLLSTARVDVPASPEKHNITEEEESEIPLDFSRISPDDDKVQFKKELEIGSNFLSESEEKPSAIKKSFNYDQPAGEKFRKLNYSDSEDGEFYKNDFQQKMQEDPEVQDTMQQFFGYEKVDKPIPYVPEKASEHPKRCYNKKSDALLNMAKIMTNYKRIQMLHCFKKLNLEVVVGKYTHKIQSAAAMVDKMSKFSRNFIAINSLSSVFKKKSIKNLAKRFQHWKCLTKLSSQSQKEKTQELHSESEQKILNAYKDSVAKLEMIEQQYSQENNKLRNQLQGALKEVDSQKSLITTQKKTIKNLESLSNTVSEAVCPRCNISLEDSMVLKHEDMHEVDKDKIQKLEQALQQKDREMNNIFKHLEEKNHHERMFKQEIHMKNQQIIQMEKERFGIINENKQLRIERTNFSEQLKILQDSIKNLKKSKLKDDKLMIDAYIQTGSKVVDACTQSEEFKVQEEIPRPKIPSEAPSNLKRGGIARKNSKRGMKRPPSKLSFSKNSPPSVPESPSPSNFSHTTAGRDSETLANELILLNREVSNLKAQLRKSLKSMKLLEKEKNTLSKNYETKQKNYDILKEEAEALMETLSTDKYKKIRVIESEKNKYQKLAQELQKAISREHEMREIQDQHIAELENRLRASQN
ncbi:unnamed protein product [Moneuplotes crassus]|uniref:Uncharacterized protein n=1 Tax=Euplotes crassus TaxID=5936 RepID=A0AAD2D230_EUPCR|nr:unnamed protein product [Moneuplotes crassus]